MNMVHSFHNGLWAIELLHRTKKRKRNPKKEETKAQSGGNGTKMVLPLNDTLNWPKRGEYGSLSSQRFVDHRTLSSHQEEKTESQGGGNGSPKWRKWYEDGATFKRRTKLTKM